MDDSLSLPEIGLNNFFDTFADVCSQAGIILGLIVGAVMVLCVVWALLRFFGFIK